MHLNAYFTKLENLREIDEFLDEIDENENLIEIDKNLEIDEFWWPTKVKPIWKVKDLK